MPFGDIDFPSPLSPFSTHRQLPHHNFPTPLEPGSSCYGAQKTSIQQAHSAGADPKKVPRNKNYFLFYLSLRVDGASATIFTKCRVPIRSEILSDSSRHWWWETGGGSGSVTIAVWSSGYSLFQFSSSAEKLRTHVGRSHSSCYQRTDITSENTTQINKDELCGSIVVYSWVIILR